MRIPLEGPAMDTLRLATVEESLRCEEEERVVPLFVGGGGLAWESQVEGKG
jgi:hypothetical protein